MQCEECGKEIQRAANHQRFCNDDCRGAYHRRKYRRAKYEAEVEAHEERIARMNGHGPDPNKKVDLVALGLAKPKPTLGLRPLGAQAKKEGSEASAVGAEPVTIEEAEAQIT
jgi:hypothetical protein